MNQKSLNGKTGEFLSQNKNQMTIKRGGGGEVKVKLTITTYISWMCLTYQLSQGFHFTFPEKIG